MRRAAAIAALALAGACSRGSPEVDRPARVAESTTTSTSAPPVVTVPPANPYAELVAERICPILDQLEDAQVVAFGRPAVTAQWRAARLEELRVDLEMSPSDYAVMREAISAGCDGW